ncbi:thyrostimulin alpha-2 subunit-like [Pecten maximus]|uniref:thyrostimulin alpha-2 subunit-like n=1 Tax=Pecten maximus TaxID=6579 RepID=UPI001458EDBC|nr:thyrostimulin alpha-2 subunit-like [Pecten maximus]
MGTSEILGGSLCKLKQRDVTDCILTIYRIFLVLNTLTALTYSLHTWERPGCYKVANERTVQIPDCLQFNVTTNACRGFCVSYAIPSSPRTRLINPSHIITSRSECCSIEETYDITVHVRCIEGIREVVFKSAKRCACSICRRG